MIQRSWRKLPIEYIDEKNDAAYLSIVFTWHLPAARMRAARRKDQGYQVLAGGPAVRLMPEHLEGLAQIRAHRTGEFLNWYGALHHHNPRATFTTRGCPRTCRFCAVPRIEGKLQELEKWPKRPIICDNNLLAASREHFDQVIGYMRYFKGDVDFNQGLDARLLTPYHAQQLAEVRPIARLAWDQPADEKYVLRAYQWLRDAGFPPRCITIFALIGFEDRPDEAEYRLQTIADLPAQPFPMRYQPLTGAHALEKNSYVAPAWTEEELRRYVSYWTRYHYHKKIPFADFHPEHKTRLKKPDNLVRFATVLGRTPQSKERKAHADL